MNVEYGGGGAHLHTTDGWKAAELVLVFLGSSGSLGTDAVAGSKGSGVNADSSAPWGNEQISRP